MRRELPIEVLELFRWSNRYDVFESKKRVMCSIDVSNSHIMIENDWNIEGNCCLMESVCVCVCALCSGEYIHIWWQVDVFSNFLLPFIWQTLWNLLHEPNVSMWITTIMLFHECTFFNVTLQFCTRKLNNFQPHFDIA